MRIRTKNSMKELKAGIKGTLADLRSARYEEIVVVCIGTDRCIGDALAPIVGTLLKEANKNMLVYGTLAKPIHALNLESSMSEVNRKHPKAFIIGIDACLSNSHEIGEIHIVDRAIHPGRGVGKTLPPVGNMCIVGITDDSDTSELFTNRSIRLSLVYGMAKDIVKALKPIILKDRLREVTKLVAVATEGE